MDTLFGVHFSNLQSYLPEIDVLFFKKKSEHMLHVAWHGS